MKRLRFVSAGVGIGLAIVAIATNNKVVTWAAIAALVTSLAVRLLLKRRDDDQPQ